MKICGHVLSPIWTPFISWTLHFKYFFLNHLSAAEAKKKGSTLIYSNIWQAIGLQGFFNVFLFCETAADSFADQSISCTKVMGPLMKG